MIIYQERQVGKKPFAYTKNISFLDSFPVKNVQEPTLDFSLVDGYNYIETTKKRLISDDETEEDEVGDITRRSERDAVPKKTKGESLDSRHKFLLIHIN
jgi:hypothetical protein